MAKSFDCALKIQHYVFLCTCFLFSSSFFQGKYNANDGLAISLASLISCNNFRIDVHPCASNPCKNGGGCVKDAKIGYRCENCDSHYTGPKCKERKITL